MRLDLFFLLVSIWFSGTLFAQTDESKFYLAKKSNTPITIDGLLKEGAWLNAQKADGFFQNYPADTSLAIARTEAFVTFDDDNIYIGAICYDQHTDYEYVVQSLRRDFDYGTNDAFVVYLDPFSDNTNGFSFGVTPYGTQREGLIQDGGNWGISTAWDNKWFSEVTIQEDRWVVEMKIPLKSIRYKGDVKEWGINFSRNELTNNENSTWSHVPRNFDVASLGFAGKIRWEEPLKKAGTNISFIPYAIGGGGVDYQSDEKAGKVNTGLDAKIAVTSSLNLDLTVNPDFSQVDVDQQVTNLSRFSLFFPERRQFFLENEDLFARFGFSQIRPFFSRRIGLNNGAAIPILGGARLSGKLNKNWRIGLMNMQTEGGEDLDVDAQNFSVGVFQRNVGARSNIGGIIVNRQSFDGNKFNYADYNRVVGLDYNVFTKSNKWRGKVFFHHSFSPTKQDYAHASWFMYNTEKITAHWNHEYVGKNYRADVGFVPRITQYNTETNEYVYSTYWRLEPSINYRFYPKNEKVVYVQPALYWSQYFTDQGKLSERLNFTGVQVSFRDKSSTLLEFNQNEVALPFKTDVTFSGNTPLDAGRYTFNFVKLNYSSSPFSTFNYGASLEAGDYYIGNKITGSVNMRYRAQPWGNFSMSARYDHIDMPEGYHDVSLWLIGPKFDLTFTKKIFFTSFFQYNTQISNLNINARFQYRFRPMSDIFIVYTDNYDSSIIGVKNRAIILKLVYWLNA